jgi:effector-binding domain-containing protein
VPPTEDEAEGERVLKVVRGGMTTSTLLPTHLGLRVYDTEVTMDTIVLTITTIGSPTRRPIATYLENHQEDRTKTMTKRHFLLLLSLLLAFGFRPADTEPKLIHRKAQPYVAIRTNVTLQNYGQKAPPLWPEVQKWLAAKGIKPSGPPIVRYIVIDMAKELQIEVGFPVSKPIQGDRRIVAGSLPAGRYVQVVHKGDYSGMVTANATLQDWAKKQGLSWKMSGNKWGGRVEFYHVDPGNTSDASKWETEILYQVK